MDEHEKTWSEPPGRPKDIHDLFRDPKFIGTAAGTLVAIFGYAAIQAHRNGQPPEKGSASNEQVAPD